MIFSRTSDSTDSASGSCARREGDQAGGAADEEAQESAENRGRASEHDRAPAALSIDSMCTYCTHIRNKAFEQGTLQDSVGEFNYKLSTDFGKSLISERLRSFISARCDVGEAQLVGRRELRDAFQAWQGGRSVPRGLPKTMAALGYVQATRAHGPNRKYTGVYLRVGLRRARVAPEETVVEVEPAALDNAVPLPTAVEVAAPEGARPTGGELVLDIDLFGEFRSSRIRKTDDMPPKISIVNLIAAVTDTSNARLGWANLSKRLAEVPGPRPKRHASN